DMVPEVAEATAAHFGYERYDTDWRTIVDAEDIDIVSVVVANSLHRELVEALLAAGKNVLCEKPLTDTIPDAEAMVAAAEAAPT
ncbi:Gfo/Idh/MocA family oxidoreductase, partial [bacterium LRH843]|nr:Gfo/Idh/MocA family oxidoreductase [bacterium LRH843]